MRDPFIDLPDRPETEPREGEGSRAGLPFVVRNPERAAVTAAPIRMAAASSARSALDVADTVINGLGLVVDIIRLFQ